MSTPASAPALISEEVFETSVDSQQSKLTKGVKRRLQRQRAAALLKSAAVGAEEQAARCLQDQRETEEQLRQLDSQLQHSETVSHSFSVSAKRYKQDKQLLRRRLANSQHRFPKRRRWLPNSNFKSKTLADDGTKPA